jgi:hypothetical protein
MATIIVRSKKVKEVDCGDPWANQPPKKKANRIDHVVETKKEEFIMADAYKSVVELGATKFEGWKRKQFEQEKVEKLGVREQKNQKMPYQMLKGIRAKRSKIEKLRETDAKNEGIVTAKKKKTRSNQGKKDSGLDVNIRGGVMRVPKSLLPAKSGSSRSR